MEHETIEHKHVLEENLSGYQRLMRRLILRLIEISTLELVVGTLHLAITAAAVFGIVGGGGGEGH